MGKYKTIEELKETDFIEYVKRKEILFMKDDMRKLEEEKTDYSKLIKYYKRRLVDYGVMKELKEIRKENKKYTKSKESIKIKELINL